MSGKPITQQHWAKLQSSRDEILEAFARGSTHSLLSKQYGCSGRVLWEWFHRADIKPLYDQAKALRALRTVEEVVEIVDAEPKLNPATGAIDGADVANRKLRADVRKWVAAKLDPATFGESVKLEGKVDVTHHVGSFVDMVRGTRLADESEAIEGESTLIATSSDD